MAPALVNRGPLASESPRQPLALSEVYRRHAGDVGRWAARLGGPGTDVEDVVQEVFLAVHGKLAGFRGESSLSTWLYRITENIVRHRRRKERWRRWVGGSAEQVAGELPTPGPTALELLSQRQVNERVYRVLDGMKERYRSMLILFELEELSGEEIAALTGAKVGTVWVWLHRARADFAKRLEELEAKEGR